jgi:uncharacterized protein with von Willebrand factor type A (vWA) domain
LFGGYLRKPKIFGTALEISLQKPLGKIKMLDGGVLEDLPVDQKGLNEYLANLDEVRRMGIQRLCFTIGRP